LLSTFFTEEFTEDVHLESPFMSVQLV